MKKGTFTLNHDRWRAAGMKSTNNSNYDCEDCLKSGITHEIVDKPGPPADGNDYCSKGDATTIRVCTGCGKYDGPWVPAYF